MAESKRFILARESFWNAEGFNKSLYNDSVVFIHNGETNEAPGKCVAIYTKGVEYPIGNALSGKTITKAFAGTDGTISYTTSGTKLDGTNANITSLSFKQGENIEITVDDKGALVIKGKDWKTEIENAVAGKNVSAEGDDYVTATAKDNKVTVAATQEIKDAVTFADSALQTVSASAGSNYVTASFADKTGENGAKSQALTVDLSQSTKTSLGLADSALQKEDIATGSANGTISVEGTDVAVAGLGSAAYTESTAYDAAGAADAVKTALLGDAETYTTLGALEDAVEAINAGAKSYTVKEVKTGLGANVEIAYQLYEKVGENETAVGSLINIPKDDSLVDVATTTDEKGNQVVKFTYNLADGTAKEITLDLSAYVTESEFGNGIEVSDNVASVKVKAGETYLKVDEDGLYTEGIATAITDAIDALDVTGDTIGSKATGTETVNVIDSLTWSETDGKVSISGTTASAATKTYVDGKFDALDATLTADNKAGSITDGYTNVITGINQVDGLVSISATAQLPTGEEVARQAAKATTKVVKSIDTESVKYLDITSTTNQDESTTYTVKVSGIDTAISTVVESLDATITATNASNQKLTTAHEGLMFDKIEQKDGKITDGKESTTLVKYVDQSKLTNYTRTGVKYIGISKEDTISQAFEKCESAWDWGTI